MCLLPPGCSPAPIVGLIDTHSPFRPQQAAPAALPVSDLSPGAVQGLLGKGLPQTLLVPESIFNPSQDMLVDGAGSGSRKQLWKLRPKPCKPACARHTRNTEEG
ncbi:hypothetical protein Cadr_000020854 [Camelus dromedarius]|uniref:Uncharacterized protein n=1 Tax=Camelus dromedarius TaxID=9838 RepID=A0A5N4CUQ9_CAMDR|nr:hypothetical protein Cadr_000020854 [Camelus dromedarius]